MPFIICTNKKCVCTIFFVRRELGITEKGTGLVELSRSQRVYFAIAASAYRKRRYLLALPGEPQDSSTFLRKRTRRAAPKGPQSTKRRLPIARLTENTDLPFIL